MGGECLGRVFDRELVGAEVAGNEVSLLPEACGVCTGHLAIVIGKVGHDAGLAAIGAPELRGDGEG